MKPTTVRPELVLDWIAAADRRIMRRVSALDSPALDQVMPELSQAANHSVIWIGIAAGLALTRKQRARRAALRGLAGIAVASTASNVLGKGLARRTRPGAAVPLARQLRRPPHTSSFPSGHAASAAAFATGAALELPVLAVPLAVVATAVGASRVVTGVHFPSDVAAGFATGVASTALIVHWWPLRRGEPDAAARRCPQGPRHLGCE